MSYQLHTTYHESNQSHAPEEVFLATYSSEESEEDREESKVEVAAAEPVNSH